MTIQRFAASHAADAAFERGQRPFFEYRDFGIAQATDGQVVAHVIRAVPGAGFSSQPHRHHTQFQRVYLLKGWIEVGVPARQLECRRRGADDRVHRGNRWTRWQRRASSREGGPVRS